MFIENNLNITATPVESYKISNNNPHLFEFNNQFDTVGIDFGIIVIL